MAFRVTLLGTGAPMHPTRALTGMIVTAPNCQPLMIDTCGGMELPRQMHKAGFSRDAVRNVIVTHKHMDHAGGMNALQLARIPLDIYANSDTQQGIKTVWSGCFPEWKLHDDIARHEISAGVPRQIGGFDVEFFDVEHRVPTLAVRITHGNRTFAFSADCTPCDEAIACADNADFFLCDAICAEADGHERRFCAAKPPWCISTPTPAKHRPLLASGRGSFWVSSTSWVGLTTCFLCWDCCFFAPR